MGLSDQHGIPAASWADCCPAERVKSEPSRPYGMILYGTQRPNPPAHRLGYWPAAECPSGAPTDGISARSWQARPPCIREGELDGHRAKLPRRRTRSEPRLRPRRALERIRKDSATQER